MADTRAGLGSLFQEEGPGRTGAPRALPQLSNPLVRKVEDDGRSFGDYFQADGNIFDRISDYLNKPETTFGGFMREEDGRGIQFGLPQEFSEQELLSALTDVKSNAPDQMSSLRARAGMKEQADRIAAMPDDADVFDSPLDDMAASIEETLARIDSSKKQNQKAEDFRQAEQKIAKDQGMIMPGEKRADVGQTAASVNDAINQAFVAGMDEYIKGVRGSGPDAKAPKDLEEYKKEFAEATGISIDGKPDKSQALMAFGLALMQNEAGGKGFSGMLSAMGKAGEAAMPALQKAKEQARNDAIAAGKYALEARSADETKAAAAREKAMERSNYYVVPRSEDVKGFLAGVGEGRGRLESLSKYEVDKLLNNPEFAAKYDILPGSTWGSIVEAAMESPEAQELYLTSGRNINLIPGIDDELFSIRVFDADPNKNPGGQPLMSGDGQQQYEALARMARDNEKAKQKFVELGVLNEGTNVFRYSVDKLNSLAAAFNVPIGDEATETDKMKKILTKLQATNAPAILGEAGKTISDADRQMVKDIVGDITIMSDPRLLAEKFEGLFNDIIMKADSDISQALSTLNRYTGRNIGGTLGEGPLNEEEAKELADSLQGMGAN